MPAAILIDPSPSAPPRRKRFTRDEVQTMLDAGIFAGQRLELIHGDLIDKMGQNPPHAYSIQLIMKWLLYIFGADVLRVQLPIEVSKPDSVFSWPEPDLAVTNAPGVAYSRRHPCGDELLLIVEVADSSLQSDAVVKRDLYARAGVSEYWVLDVNARKLLVHRNPGRDRFDETFVLGETELVSPACRPEVSVSVAEFLPAE